MPESWDVEVFERIAPGQHPATTTRRARKFVAVSIHDALRLTEEALRDDKVGAVVAYRTTEGDDAP